MLDQIFISVRDLLDAERFYEAVASALGFSRAWEEETAIAWAAPGARGLLVLREQRGIVSEGSVIALPARDAEAVRNFHRAGLVAGGRDEGAPRPAPLGRDGTYGAVLRDREGNRVAAICAIG